MLPHFLARAHELTCLDSDLAIDQPIWLVIQSDLAQSRRVRAVAEFLGSLVRRNGAALSGADPHAGGAAGVLSPRPRRGAG